ncbi:MAG: hypothetical protein AAF685_16100, partial [Cyanobacteria bacterium P01_C01_bin.89]
LTAIASYQSDIKEVGIFRPFQYPGNDSIDSNQARQNGLLDFFLWISNSDIKSESTHLKLLIVFLAAILVFVVFGGEISIKISDLVNQITTVEQSKEIDSLKTTTQEIYVYDASTQKPLSGVDVRFLTPGGIIANRTNSDGFIELTVPKSEDIDIGLSKDGYETQKKKLNLITDAERRKIYYLKPN